MGFILRNSLALLFSFSFVFIAEQKPIKLHPNASNLRWNLFFRSARTFLVSPFVGPSARPQQKCQLMEIHYKSLHYHVISCHYHIFSDNPHNPRSEMTNTMKNTHTNTHIHKKVEVLERPIMCYIFSCPEQLNR